ncbi:hypothetical protein FNF29_05502 [Cafeteria roenbergensis]|uniref:Tetratricopeptide repeat-like domain-containing protein n=1 Tax=Cafeteria roenbergensis TaxID=33653 RepID=A0A5A8CE21_CAFRO|nr:hypothetical protein FNF29_05502 [Cafeteria roenbergensis]|eukprot:KAA0150061.1 hypothetical protein FNF29_05502 [Cafeteria roenbergensis]
MAADVAALLASYARLGLFKHISTVCSEVIAKRGNDPVIVLWSAFGSAMEGNAAAAIRQADTLRTKRQVALASLVCLEAFHRRASMVDRAALESVNSDMRSAEREASPKQLALAATFAVHLRQWDRALGLADAAVTAAGDDPDCLTANGWAELGSGGAEAAEAALALLDRAIASVEAAAGAGSGAVDARMGKAVALRSLGRHSEALDALNDVVAVNRWMLPAIAERGRLHARQGDWEGVGEASAALLASDPLDVEGQMLACLKALAGDGDAASASMSMRQLLAAVAKHEPGNASLILHYARPLARLAGDSRPVLDAALKLTRSAMEADPRNAQALAETGSIQAQLGDLDAATESFTAAARLDDTCVEAVAGLIWCQLAAGRWEDAGAQLEMFGMVQETVGRSAHMALLDAIVAWRRSADPYAHVAYLAEARTIHAREWRKARADPSVSVYEALTALDPTLMLRIARELLIHARSSDGSGGDDGAADGGGGAEGDEEAAAEAASGAGSDASIRRAASVGLAILKEVASVAPGMSEARLLLARAHLRAGNADEASRALVDVLAADSGNAPAHLLMAQVALAQGLRHLPTAKASLEQALAHNLRAHASPVYQLVAARVAYAERKYADAARAAQLAIKALGAGAGSASGGGGAAAGGRSGGGRPRGTAEGALATVSAGPMGDLTDSDRVRLYVLLAESHTARDQLKEATAVIDDATSIFAGTPEEVDVLIAHARLTLAKGSAEAAVRMLGGVPTDSPAFGRAQRVKADILLKHRRDRRAFIQCFREVVERRPTTAARVALSEAYMRISMPEEAVASLQDALDDAPDDGALVRRMGRALVRMHDFDRAARYYDEALRRLEAGSAGSATSLDAGLIASLRQDLVELLVRQRRFSDAQALIDEDLARTERDAISLRGTRQSLRAMAQVQQGIGDAGAAVVTLEHSLKVQQRIVTLLRRDAPELLAAEKDSAADLCHEVAQALLAARPPDEAQAQRYLREGLHAKESHVPCLLALSRLLLRRGEVAHAERAVVSLRRAAPGSVDARMLEAELQLAQGSVDAAAYQMGELLEARPGEHDALARAVRLLKLAGRLDDAEKMVAVAERAGKAAAREPGVRFCRGLVNRYRNKPEDAIACFNEARHSAAWGVRAVEQMVWTYVSPDGDAVWRTARSDRDDDGGGDGAGRGGPAMGPRGRRGGAAAAATGADRKGGEATSPIEASDVALALLGGIAPKNRTRQHSVLRAYALMIRGQPSATSEAQAILAELFSADEAFAPAIAAMATLLLLSGETTKAKNQLKHLSRLPVDVEASEDFVRGYLMLADVQMEASKNDIAIRMCQEALKRDRASALAWEILGDIAEREMSYADAADHFAKAWAVDSERTARVGYKLAFNYLKSRRFTKAIDICHKVLEHFPGYPKIQETIIDVARKSLRA